MASAGHLAGTGAVSGSGGADGGAPAPGKTSLSGTLGTLGVIKPVASSFVISNGREVIIYMSSDAFGCDQLQTSRWLGSIASGAQVVEIVVPVAKTSGTVTTAQGAEVNYAAGGKSSSYEKGASTGSVTFSSFEAGGVAEGSVTASYQNPAGSVMGTFHAEFCEGGQEF